MGKVKGRSSYFREKIETCKKIAQIFEKEYREFKIISPIVQNFSFKTLQLFLFAENFRWHVI